MRVPVAREGYPFILAAALPAIALLILAGVSGGLLAWLLAGVTLLLAAAITAFFRDPERQGPRGEDIVLAPADGKVIDICTTDEPAYIKGEALRISIFLSLLDVHVNRYPVSGNVQLRSYDKGRFEPAWRRSASHSNERASTGIRGSQHAALIRQIGGLAARRIVTYAQLGDRVTQGTRMGLIRFGSRVDVYLPQEATPTVRVGERAVGAVTVIARFPNPSGEKA